MKDKSQGGILRVGIIGAGAWGTAIGKVTADNGHKVEIWDYLPQVVEEINTKQRNDTFLLGVDLPSGLRAKTDLEQVCSHKEILFIATPSMYLLDTVKKILRIPNIMEGETLIAVLTKGFLPSAKGPRLILNSLEDYLPGFYRGNLVYISGPSHAEEVSRGKLTGLVSASENGKNAIRVRECITGKNLVVFPSLDVVGVQVSAAVKNVIALAFGMLDGLMEFTEYFGDNTESLLLAAGLNEMMLIGQALGSTHPETFTSIAGVGDLDVTCRSRYGRNRRFGKEVIQDRTLTRFDSLENLIERIHEVGYLPEGVVAAREVHLITKLHSLKLPICGSVYSILNRDQEPFDAIREMLEALTRHRFQVFPRE